MVLSGIFMNQRLFNVAWDSFVNKFTNVCDKHAPVYQV